MAAFNKQPNGKWRVRVRKNGQTLTKTFTYKADADIWAREIESEIERWVDVVRRSKDKTTFGDLLERYAVEYAPTLKGGKREVSRARQIAVRRLGGLPVYRMTSDDIAAFRNERMDEGLSPSTVRKELSTISGVFELAIKEWGFDGLTNLVRLIKKPKGMTRREMRLTPDEVTLLWAIPDDEIRRIAVFALETSARQLEIVSLRWSDVDLSRRTATVHDKVGQHTGRTKRLPLSSRAVAVLNETRSRLRPFCPDNMEPDSFSGWVSEQWKNKKVKWGFRKELWLRDIRHEAISRFFEKGLSVVEVMSITGHTNPAQLDTYTHLMHQTSLASRLD